MAKTKPTSQVAVPRPSTHGMTTRARATRARAARAVSNVQSLVDNPEALLSQGRGLQAAARRDRAVRQLSAANQLLARREVSARAGRVRKSPVRTIRESPSPRRSPPSSPPKRSSPPAAPSPPGTQPSLPLPPPPRMPEPQRSTPEQVTVRPVPPNLPGVPSILNSRSPPRGPYGARLPPIVSGHSPAPIPRPQWSALTPAPMASMAPAASSLAQQPTRFHEPVVPEGFTRDLYRQMFQLDREFLNDMEFCAKEGENLEDITVLQALAAVTEALAQNGVEFSLVDLNVTQLPVYLQRGQQADPELHWVARPGKEALFMHTNAGQVLSQHTSLFVLRRAAGGERFEFCHFDSLGPLKRASHTHSSGHTAARIHEFILDSAYWGRDRYPSRLSSVKKPWASPPPRRVNAREQQSNWECGMYTVLYGWLTALGLQPRDAAMLTAQDNSDFVRDGVDMVNKARYGSLDSGTILQFLKFYGFVDGDAGLALDRQFDRTVPFLAWNDVSERVARLNQDWVLNLNRELHPQRSIPSREEIRDEIGASEQDMLDLSAWVMVERWNAKRVSQGREHETLVHFPPGYPSGSQAVQTQPAQSFQQEGPASQPAPLAMSSQQNPGQAEDTRDSRRSGDEDPDSLASLFDEDAAFEDAKE